MSCLSFSQSMKLGVPVLARNIPGNAAVIKHRESGLLFNTPQVPYIMLNMSLVELSC